MFTLFDLIQVLVAIAGAICGGALGAEHGTVFGIFGALVGGGMGYQLGAWPTKLMIKAARREYAPLTVADLEAKLDMSCWTPNLILLELQARGENVGKHLPLLLSLLQHEDLHCRTRGYAALLSVFPDKAKKLAEYNPTQTAELCRKALSRALDELR